MGKTACLRLLARQVGRRALQKVVLVLGGSLIASERHFFSLTSNALGERAPASSRWEDNGAQVVAFLKAKADTRILWMIDDFDDLAFKREPFLEFLATSLTSMPHVLLVATCKPSSRDRLMARGRPFAKRMDATILQGLSRDEAAGLVRLRAPDMSGELVKEIIEEAGPHPAALVFLSRLVELRGRDRSRVNFQAVLTRAAELAGAVYAEPWASLSPQQRAILWQLSLRVDREVALSQIADAVLLESPHVSAQLTRLVDEGLVHRASTRGKYQVTPLLSRWIRTRVAGSRGATGRPSAHRKQGE